MSDISGTIKKVTFDGITFDAMADTNITEKFSLYEKEAIPTSGRNIFKMTKQATLRESVTIAANGEEMVVLKELSERTEDFPMSYTTASDDTYRTTGTINIENRETETLKCSITMIPRNDWEEFLAN